MDSESGPPNGIRGPGFGMFHIRDRVPSDEHLSTTGNLLFGSLQHPSDERLGTSS